MNLTGDLRRLPHQVHRARLDYFEGGFGYDPYFQLDAEGVTAAELPAETKNRMSHRGQAVRRLVQRLAAGG